MASVSVPAVDGTFTDDVGFGGEHNDVAKDLGLTAEEVQQLSNVTMETYRALLDALVKAGKYNWQSLGAMGDFAGPGIVRNASSPHATWTFPLGCIDFMRRYCPASAQGAPMLMGILDPEYTPLELSVAAFLVVRPPVAYLGWGWEGFVNHDAKWDPIFRLDVGEPKGLCEEVRPGVFSREWTKGTASVDCNEWTWELRFGGAGLGQLTRR